MPQGVGAGGSKAVVAAAACNMAAAFCLPLAFAEIHANAKTPSAAKAQLWATLTCRWQCARFSPHSRYSTFARTFLIIACSRQQVPLLRKGHLRAQLVYVLAQVLRSVIFQVRKLHCNQIKQRWCAGKANSERSKVGGDMLRSAEVHSDGLAMCWAESVPKRYHYPSRSSCVSMMAHQGQ